MLDTIAETRPDRRPALVICAYDVGESAWDPAEDLSGATWSPSGARTVDVPAEDPERLASILSNHLRDADCRAILLVGRTRRSTCWSTGRPHAAPSCLAISPDWLNPRHHKRRR